MADTSSPDPPDPPDPTPPEAPWRPHSPRQALLLLIISLGLFWAATPLMGLKGTFAGDLYPALVVLAWILPAYFLINRTGRDPFEAHGLLVRPRKLLPATAFSVLVLTLFVLVFWLRNGTPEFPFVRWGETFSKLVWWTLFTALHEEYFFRGVLQPSLDREGGPKTTIMGAPFGRGAVLAAALFALCHVWRPGYGFDPTRLVVFFPGLWFAWLRNVTGSIVPAIVAHGLANTVQWCCFQAWPA